MGQGVKEETVLVWDSSCCDCRVISHRGRVVLISCADHRCDVVWKQTMLELGGEQLGKVTAKTPRWKPKFKPGDIVRHRVSGKEAVIQRIFYADEALPDGYWLSFGFRNVMHATEEVIEASPWSRSTPTIQEC